MMILSGLLGGLVSDFYIEGIFLLAFVAAVIYIGISLIVMPKVETVRKTRTQRQISEAAFGVKKVIKESVQYCMKDKNVWNVILFNSILTFAFSPVFVFWSPVLHSFDRVNYTVIGLAWVLMRAAMLAGNAVLERRKERSFSALAVISAGCGISVFALAYLNTFWSLLFGILLFEFILGIIYPLKETVLNEGISHENRATVLSFHSMIVSIFNYISMLVMGKIAEIWSIETTWKISGLLLVSAGIVTVIKKREKHLS